MAGIASKNLFDLLGDDGAEPTAAPTTKVAAKGGKAGVGAGTSAPKADFPARGGGGGNRGPRDGAAGSDAAFRDRGAGSRQNRDRESGEPRGEYRGRGEGRGDGRGRGRGRGRGGHGRSGGALSDDRHSKTGIVDHEKQAGHGWGANTGGAEWADEQAGEAIAKNEEATGDDVAAETTADAEPAEEEVKTKTLDDYLAEQAQKRLQIAGQLEVRKPNEGVNKKLQKGQEISREDEEEDFIAGAGGKKARERARKEKNVLELDGDAMRIKESGGDRRGGRGGRGRGGDFGGRGRGDRGDRGDRGESRGEGRGESRGEGRGGGRGRGDREFRGGDRPRGGDFRGSSRGGARGRGGPGGNAPNVSDESAFPSLGA